MENAPIQVILNADNFRKDRETTTPKGAGKDFYQGRNAEFAQHRQRIQEQVRSIHDQLAHASKQPNGADVAYLKVSLNGSALAKSHRPIRALFTPERAPVRGSTRLGEIITEVNTAHLADLDRVMALPELVWAISGDFIARGACR
jgi:hypothetical protein